MFVLAPELEAGEGDPRRVLEILGRCEHGSPPRQELLVRWFVGHEGKAVVYVHAEKDGESTGQRSWGELGEDPSIDNAFQETPLEQMLAVEVAEDFPRLAPPRHVLEELCVEFLPRAR